jgi:two-component system sensor histidine kinase VicK
MRSMIEPNPISCSLDLRSTLEAMDDLAFVFDANADLIFINQSALHLFGFASLKEVLDDVAGASRLVRVVRVYGHHVAKPLDIVRQALAGEKVIEDLERVEPVDGRPHVILRMTLNPIIDANGVTVGVLKIGHDVTFERELANLKEDFVRVASHELRTPATILRLAANRLLSSETLPPDELRKRAEMIDRATRRIECISSRLDDMASISCGAGIALDLAQVSLDAIVADVVARLDGLEAGRIHLSSMPASARGDARRLRQVIASVLDNALRYSMAPAPVEVTVSANDELAEVAVVDHGVGILPDKRTHLFESFYRAHNGASFDRGGLGASLYLAAQIMRAHHGRIWFEPNASGGSIFRIALDATRSVE